MVTYVLDSSAILRYVDDEAGADRVAEIIKSHLAGQCVAIMSALHWGEVAGIVCKTHGKQAMEMLLARLRDVYKRQILSTTIPPSRIVCKRFSNPLSAKRMSS